MEHLGWVSWANLDYLRRIQPEAARFLHEDLVTDRMQAVRIQYSLVEPRTM